MALSVDIKSGSKYETKKKGGGTSLVTFLTVSNKLKNSI